MNGHSAAVGTAMRLHIIRILPAAIGLLLAWAVIESAVTHALVPEDAAADALVSSRDPRAVLAAADTEMRRTYNAVSQSIVASALKASVRAPLEETPFVIAGARALAVGEGDRAERLLSEARARNPRSRLARFYLLERYARTGRVKEAVGEMAVLARLMPEARPLLIMGLAHSAMSSSDSSAITQVLRSDPVIHNDVMEHLATTNVRPELVLRLAEGSRPKKHAQWPRLLLMSLVKQGDVLEAYTFWRRLVGVRAESAPIGVYNSRFEVLSSPPPFNWQLTERGAGIARLGGAGTLEIEFRGGARMQLASQLLLLPSGRYTLTFNAKGDAPEGAGKLIWMLLCHNSGNQLAVIPISASPYIVVPSVNSFQVPDGCPAQWLALIGEPGKGARTVNVTISEFEISRSDVE